MRHATVKQQEDEIRDQLEWRRTQRPAAKKYGGSCIAPFHYEHLDSLLLDMGAPCTSGNLFRDYFSYPHATDYAKMLASAPRYKVAEG